MPQKKLISGDERVWGCGGAGLSLNTNLIILLFISGNCLFSYLRSGKGDDLHFPFKTVLRVESPYSCERFKFKPIQ